MNCKYLTCQLLTLTRSPTFSTTNSRYDCPPKLNWKMAEFDRELGRGRMWRHPIKQPNNERGYFNMQKRSARFMFYPSSWQLTVLRRVCFLPTPLNYAIGCGLSAGSAGTFASGVQFSIFASDPMPGYQAVNGPLPVLLQCKILWENCVEWRSSSWQRPEKDQSFVKVGRNDVHYIQVRKLWVRLLKYLPIQC